MSQTRYTLRLAHHSRCSLFWNKLLLWSPVVRYAGVKADTGTNKQLLRTGLWMLPSTFCLFTALLFSRLAFLCFRIWSWPRSIPSALCLEPASCSKILVTLLLVIASVDCQTPVNTPRSVRQRQRDLWLPFSNFQLSSCLSLLTLDPIYRAPFSSPTALGIAFHYCSLQ